MTQCLGRNSFYLFQNFQSKENKALFLTYPTILRSGLRHLMDPWQLSLLQLCSKFYYVVELDNQLVKKLFKAEEL